MQPMTGEHIDVNVRVKIIPDFGAIFYIWYRDTAYAAPWPFWPHQH